MTPRVSLIVRALNEAAHIGRLLDGVAQQTVQDSEVILVDSGSTDATVAIARQHGAHVVHIDPDDFSFGRSLNAGCGAASGNTLVIASAHVYPVYKDWLEKLIAPLDDPRIALTYGMQRGDDTTHFSEHQIFRRWFPEEPNPDQDHPFCNNANAAVRRALWAEMPYDEDLTGLEDIDWAKRAQARGYKIAYVPEAVIIHVHDEPPRRLFNRYRREAIAMKRIFPEERFALWDFARLVTANIWADGRAAAREGALWRSLGDIVRFRLAQFWGTYRGYAQRQPTQKQLMETFYYPGGRDAARREPGEDEQDRRVAYGREEEPLGRSR